MYPPPGATTIDVPLGFCVRYTAIVGSVTSVTRVALAGDASCALIVASDLGTLALGTPSGQSLNIRGKIGVAAGFGGDFGFAGASAKAAFAMAQTRRKAKVFFIWVFLVHHYQQSV